MLPNISDAELCLVPIVLGLVLAAIHEHRAERPRYSRRSESELFRSAARRYEEETEESPLEMDRRTR